MAIRSFQARLLYLLIAVLVLLEAGTLISVHLAGQRTLRKTIAEELRVGARVFHRVLDTRAQQLSDTLRVLALDFAFRESIASADVPTITSVLANSGARIGADAVVLVSLDGTVTADTLGGRMIGRRFPFESMLQLAQDRGEASDTVSFGRRPYQFVIVPVLAPRQIAWVCAGFEIDDRVLAEVRRLTSLDVSVWSSSANAAPQLMSTLPPQQRSDLVAHMGERGAQARRHVTLQLGETDYATLFEPLRTGDNSRVNTVLQRSIAEAGKPFVTLELQIFALSSLLLLAAVIAAVLFARTISRPLRVLADGAGRIERGDYVTPVDVEREDEIGQLATAFNEMQSAIATREDQIMFQATHDALTGLPNRTLFLDRVMQTIAAAKGGGPAVGMLMMDVDRFKDINDTLGHHFGDQLLIEIGRRLTKTVGAQQFVARLGGDEFAIVFTARSAEEALAEAARVETAFNAPYVLGDVAIDVNASVGIALFPMHADDADTLMKRADIAMYDAKKNQGGVAMYEAGRDE
ncbi:MAG TPA: diguanylate cyclase, partial [Thermoanaerobaculia bacterium]